MLPHPSIPGAPTPRGGAGAKKCATLGTFAESTPDLEARKLTARSDDMRLVIVGAALVAACSDGGGTAAPDASLADAAPRQVVTATRQLLVGELAEAILDGGPGDVAMISLSAPVANLDWNIHGHANGSTQTVVEELGVMTVRYTFAPTAQADWYLLLRNKDAAPMSVEVELALYGDMQWSGWQ